jgi:apolipoprotein N-acyltransferase
MKISSHAKNFLPEFPNLLWTINSAILLVFAFPDFDIWYLAYVALIPFFYALDQEKQSKRKSFTLGWIWGTTFFFGTCWWLSVPMIETGGIPKPIAYLMVLIVTAIAGLFPAIFALIQSILLKRFGIWAMVYTPFIWVFTEFLRFWLTGNNWNAIGYSQAFANRTIFRKEIIDFVSIGGVLYSSFSVLVYNTFLSLTIISIKIRKKKVKQLTLVLALFPFLTFFFPVIGVVLLFSNRFIEANIARFSRKKNFWKNLKPLLYSVCFVYFTLSLSTWFLGKFNDRGNQHSEKNTTIIAIQPNVPTSGVTHEKWKQLRQRHVELAESALQRTKDKEQMTIVIFPESPMNFEYLRDAEMREFFKDFAVRNNAKILFNSGEPVYPQYIHREPYSMTKEQLDQSLEAYNSAVLVDQKGDFEAQYDKIHLLPFGEFIPLPKFLADFVPPVVGNFTFGKEYDILKFGEVNAGVMICFESHFPSLSNQLTANGADVLVEMTNDGYLGNTAVLRQHLANAVFRAVETNRPVLRVTNVGITALIDESGTVIEPTSGFTEDVRVWTVGKSDGKQTFYVKYGDWFAWFCSGISIFLLLAAFRRKR